MKTYSVLFHGVPVQTGTLHELFPSTIFPLEGPSQEWLDQHSVVEVESPS